MDAVAGSLSPKDACLERKGSRIGSDQAGDSEAVISFGSRDVALLKLSNGEDSSGSVALVLAGENAELSSSSDRTEEDDLALGCQTPAKSIFDPFAPGPEELGLAPKKRTLKRNRIPLQGHLNFESCCDYMEDVEGGVLGDAAEEDHFLESPHTSSVQPREMPAKDSSAESSPSEGFKTPTSVPLLTWIADACPAAPTRPTSKSRRLGKRICRKLEF